MKPIRVAFSGAGFKIPAHVGALQAIVDEGYEPVEIVGTSAGSIVGALYACGMSLSDMKALALTHDWTRIMSWNPLSAFRLGFCNGKNLLAFLNEHTGGKTFADLSIDLTAVASNLTDNSDFLFSKRRTPDVSVALAVRASASLPFVFEMVEYQGARLVDGGCVDNIGCDLLAMDEVPRLGVQLVSQDLPIKPTDRMNVVSLSMRLIDLMLSACESAHVTAGQMAGASMAFVECGYASTLDRNAPREIRQRLFADGYAATKRALEGITQTADFV